MDQEYTITPLDAPELFDAWGILGNALTAYNHRQAGDDQSQRICFVIKNGGETVGGVIGVVYWDWLSVEVMWVRDDLRGCGYGTRLLALLEQEAVRRGAKHAHLDTFSFQAPDFYQKHGYRVFGELPDFPAGQRRYYLTKEL